MSEARISPPAPVPQTSARLTPRSPARRRALGEILGDGVVSCAGLADRFAGVVIAEAGEGTTVVFLPDSTATSSAGGVSPGRTIQAIVWPTGTSIPACTLIPARTPSPGDSISITALSVSISSSGSPLATASPSFFSHEISLPVSCAISSAGITTLIAIIVRRSYSRVSISHANALLPRTRFDQLAHALVRLRFGFPDRGERTIHREIVSAGHQQFFGREARDDFVAGFGDHDFFFDAGRAPSIGRGPESFEREHHARLDFAGMFQ